MKIISKGVDPKEVPFNLACSKCMTVVEVTKRELKSFDGGYHNEENADYIECPVCKNLIYDTADIRKLAWKILDQKEKAESVHRDPRGDDFNPWAGYYDSEPKGRSGGPTGPCPPPELPLLPCVGKVVRMATK